MIQDQVVKISTRASDWAGPVSVGYVDFQSSSVLIVLSLGQLDFGSNWVWVKLSGRSFGLGTELFQVADFVLNYD